MAAIDDYLLQLMAQLKPLIESSRQFETRISRLGNPALVVSVSPWIICCCWAFLSIPKELSWLFLILIYLPFYTLQEITEIKNILAKLFIKDFSSLKEINKEIINLEEKINITNDAIVTIQRIEHVQSSIKRSIDRVNLSEFNSWLGNLEFKDYSGHKFRNVIEPCKWILNRIENYPTTPGDTSYKADYARKQSSSDFATYKKTLEEGKETNSII